MTDRKCSLCKGAGSVTWHNGGGAVRGDYTSVERCHECGGDGLSSAGRIQDAYDRGFKAGRESVGAPHV